MANETVDLRVRQSDQWIYVAGLIGASVVLVALLLPWAQGRVYVADDLPMYHLPWRAFYSAALQKGESFLWNPALFGGFYGHGEGQAGMLHPLHLLLYGTLPLEAAFYLEELLNYVALLCGMFLFLRRWGLARGASMFGALVFAFSGFNLLHFVHPNMVAVVAHTPWLLLAIETATTGTDPHRVAGARFSVGLLTTSQLLTGHPQAVWLSVVLEAAYALVRAFQSPAPSRRLAGLLLGKALGGLGGGMQILPTWDVVSASVRAMPVGSAAFSLVPADLTQLVAPYLAKTRVFGGPFPHEFGIYCGAAASASVAWLLIRRASLPDVSRSLATAALTLVGLATVLALGRYGVLYSLTAQLPLVSLFRAANRFVVLAHFGMAVCSAIACADLVALSAGRASAARSQVAMLVLLPVTSALVTLAAFGLRAWPQFVPQLAGQIAGPGPALGGLALMTLVALLFAAAARGARIALPVLALVTALDLGFYGVSYLRRPFSPVTVAELVAGSAAPPEPSSERVQSSNNMLTLRGLRLAGGYGAFRPIGRLDELDPQRLRLAGVRWVQVAPPWAPQAAADADRPDWQGQIEPAGVTYDVPGRPSPWARVLRPMPRAWLVASEVVSTTPERDIATIDLESTALVDEGHGLTPGPAGTATVVTDTAGHIRVRADTPTRQLLIVSERWHNGWQAVVDGRPGLVVQADGDFTGVVLEPGTRDVELLFWPASLRVGLWLSAAGVGLLTAIYATSRMRRPAGMPAALERRT